MTLHRCLCLLASSLLAGCGGSSTPAETPEPAPVTEPAPETAQPAADEAATEAPERDVTAEMSSLESSAMMPEAKSMSRSRGPGGASFADEKDRECHDRCDAIADDTQDSSGGNLLATDLSVNRIAECHKECARQDGVRDAFLECIRNASSDEDKERCRESFREDRWTDD